MEQARQPYRIRPSGISVHYDGDWYGRCPRAAAYDRLGFEPAARSGRMMLLLDDSSWHEELTADWIRKSTYKLHSVQMGIDCMDIEGVALPAWHCDICHDRDPDLREFTKEGCIAHLQPGKRLHGHIDGILEDLVGVERVYEHKAINHFTFERYWKGEPPIAYITQPCLYLIGLKKLLVELKEILLVIKNKMTSQYLDFLIEYDIESDVAIIKEMEHSGYGKQVFDPPRELKGLVTSAVETFKQTEWHWKASQELGKALLPPRPFNFDDWQCNPLYCPYSHDCWEGYEEEFQQLDAAAELGQDFAGLMAREIYLAEQESHYKKERGELREKFTKLVRDGIEARSGRATAPPGSKTSDGKPVEAYTFNLKLTPRTKLIEERIPFEIRQEASEKTFSESLYIRPVLKDAGKAKGKGKVKRQRGRKKKK